MAEKKRRSAEQARALVRALRARYVTKEMEEAAKRGIVQAIQAKAPKPDPQEPNLIEVIRRREQIRAAPFSQTEADQARRILSSLKQAFPTKH